MITMILTLLRTNRYWACFVLGLFTHTRADTYANTMALFNDKLASDHYKTEIRPLSNQSQTLYVLVEFELVSIVELNDVTQSFVANGFLMFFWTDEIVAWDPESYGGVTVIHPLPEQIWRPRVVLVNTLGDRDLFGDDKAPVFVYYNGNTNWAPGSLFPISCHLQMTNYPFDKQTCSIKLVAMTLSTGEMQFVSNSADFKRTFFTPHGEWDLLEAKVKVTDLDTGDIILSSVELTFTMKRRPNFLLMNIVLPVVFLSFLNLLVFVIPVESGEKIAYGITVLLALSVFMSIVSSMLPRSSLTMPKVTIYLFILLTISVLTVIDSIIIVYLSHMEEKEELHQKAKKKFQSALKKVAILNRAVSPAPNPSSNRLNTQGKNKISLMRLSSVESFPSESELPPYTSEDRSNRKDSTCETSASTNKYKVIGKHIDLVSFVVFFILWFSVTIGFMLNIALS